MTPLGKALLRFIWAVKYNAGSPTLEERAAEVERQIIKLIENPREIGDANKE
jgi:hypothetical protein